jgi:hypothetical protein
MEINVSHFLSAFIFFNIHLSSVCSGFSYENEKICHLSFGLDG